MDTQTVSDWNIEIQRRRTVLLDRMLLAAMIGGLIVLGFLYVGLQATSVPERVTEMVPLVAVWLVTPIIWFWRGLNHRLRAWILVLLTFLVGIIVFWQDGLPGSGRIWLLLPPALAFVLLGPRSGIAAGVGGVLIYVCFAIAIGQKWIIPRVEEDPLALLIVEGGSFILVAAILTLLLRSFGQNWLEALMGASMANKQLEARTGELEDTNVRLHRQTSQLQATAEIARAGSSILKPETLLNEVVNRIQEGFRTMDVYYVGLFLLEDAGADADEQSAVLRAATGEAGQLLLEMGHKLKVDETSAIGWCITYQRARIAMGMEEGTVQIDAVPMPHTRSEIALPLRSRGRILGALSVQSSQEAAFSEPDVVVLQTMADQVAIAIDNARLFSQTEAALKEVQATHRRYLAQAWKDFLVTRPEAQIDYYQPGTESGDGEFLREARRAAMVHGRTVAIDNPSPGPDGEAPIPQAALVVPLKLREQVIGTMALHETRRQRPWTTREITLAENVAEQFALTVENLRLMDETQRRAAREQLVGKISDQMQRAADMEALMRIAAEELNRVLRGSRVYVHLSTGTRHSLENNGHAGEGDD